MTFFELMKSDTSKVVVDISEYKGNKYFSVREMWRRDKEDEWKYSKKIINLTYAFALDFLKKIKQINEEELIEKLK